MDVSDEVSITCASERVSGKRKDTFGAREHSCPYYLGIARVRFATSSAPPALPLPFGEEQGEGAPSRADGEGVQWNIR
jgi:hypothetical protein